MAHVEDSGDLPVISDVAEFDVNSGNLIERLVFNNRLLIVVLCALMTVYLGYYTFGHLKLQAGFEKMLPKNHPYVKNYKDNEEYLKGLGNVLRLAVETDEPTIYTPQFLDTLKDVSDAVFYIPGVVREDLKSLWTPNTRYKVVTEEGFEGGPVVPPDYDGSAQSIGMVKLNVARAGLRGDLVANNEQSSSVLIPLMDFDPETGKRLDYYQFSSKLEEVRTKFQHAGETVQGRLEERLSKPDEEVAHKVTKNLEKDIRDEFESGRVKLHIIGFAKIVGELIDGLFDVMLFFVGAVIIAALLLYWYTRCWRSTLVVIVITIGAVIWQLGLLTLFGFELDPYSILVPFLVFAIGVSHGAQKLNGILQDIGRGCHRYVAARYTFRRLFLAGFTALASDGIGFAVLMIIQIQVIQDLAITASIGVVVLIFTNLILIPVVLSYLGVTQHAAERAHVQQSPAHKPHPIWLFLLCFTERRWATGAIVVSLALTVAAFFVAQDLQIGDLDPGAPELRAESRYNQDVKFMIENYSVSSDIFAVIVKTDKDMCTDHETLSLAEELEWRFRQQPGVEDVIGLNTMGRRLLAGLNEGYIRWLSMNRNQSSINYAAVEMVDQGMVNPECSVWPMLVYLSDHKAKTLQNMVDTLEQFNEEWPSDKVQFLGAAGNAGFEAATNIVVRKANREMMFYVYAAVILLSYITFRSVPGVLCAVLPLVATSILCEALMVFLGIGVKVATLPVIALGVGIGIDYALYVLTVVLAKTRAGMPLRDAYFAALSFTGRVVALIGITLAAGVVTWAWSPIKFQADMGLLLTFMFLWNMVGALVLMPALAHFLLPAAKDPQPVAAAA
ncbi:MAG: MMPL family transporter [Gammaproteobacteria bacterium]|nr:MMPL family transporter [Gammaproteobacteria bacterium]